MLGEKLDLIGKKIWRNVFLKAGISPTCEVPFNCFLNIKPGPAFVANAPD